MGYRFYRCQDCSWRGKEQAKKKKDRFSGKVSLWKVLGLYALAMVIIVYAVFVIVDAGDTPPVQENQQLR